MITRTIPFQFESNLITSVRNGSQFSVSFGESVNIPREAQEIFVQVTAAEIWNSFPNIESGVNSSFVFSYLADVYTLELPTGAYSVASINAVFQPQLQALGFPGLIKLSEAVEQSRVVITFKFPGITYLAELSTMSDIIGFVTDVTSDVNSLVFYANNIAGFNVVNKLFLHTSLPVSGIISNGISTNILAKIPITATPGFQFIYTPFRPAAIPAPALSGFTIRDITFWLTDEQNRPVNTFGETWGFSLDIVYEERRRFHVS
jgi:hypothetical protein